MAKNLPIKVFKKRVTDERLTEGGGSAKLPDWILSDEELEERSIIIHSFLSDLKEKVLYKNSVEDFLPTVITANLFDEAIAKSHRSKVNQIFNVNHKMNIIGFGAGNSLLIKIDNKNDLDSIDRNIIRKEKNAYGISAIEDIDLYEPDISIVPGSSLKAEVFNYYDSELNKLVKERFVNLCGDLNIEYKETIYSEQKIIFKIDNYDEHNLEKLKSFSGLQSLKNMPFFETLYNDQGEEVKIKVRIPDKEAYYPTIGVLDSGISKIPHLDPWIDGLESIYIEDDINRNHGTFVSGIIIYGDQLEQESYTGSSGCKLFDATVFPKYKGIPENELLDNIRDIIEKYPAINIWHMSLGSNRELDINNVSDFGSALDELQKKNNILIIKSAGNCYNYKKNAPRQLLSNGSDSIRSIIVGSIAHKKRDNDLAEVNHPSPFSVSGFALSNIIKPDLTHYGGNAGIIGTGTYCETGVNSFDSSGKIVSHAGTSFSTPRVTAIAAEIIKNLETEFNPLLIKGLLIHSAKYPSNINLDFDERLKLMGFGVPSNATEILFNDPNEITLILSDKLEKGSFLEILDFPFPEEMQEDGMYYGEIILTLVSSPVLDPNQGPEYCQSNIEVFLGTFDDIVEREGPTIRNPLGRTISENFLKSSVYSSSKQKRNTEFLKERFLINYSKKYQPVKKWVINLEECKNSITDLYLRTPKRWYLKLTGLYRDFTETRFENLAQDFCLIITIRDNKRRHNIYQSISTQLNQRNFINSNIQLRGQVVLRAD